MTANTTPSRTLTKGYDLLDYKLEHHPLNDALSQSMSGDTLTVSAIKFTSNPAGRVLVRISGSSFEYSSQITPDSARKIGAALFAAAIAVEDFEAAECIAQERELDQDRELAQYNAGPIERMEIGGNVVELRA